MCDKTIQSKQGMLTHIGGTHDLIGLWESDLSPEESSSMSPKVSLVEYSDSEEEDFDENFNLIGYMA